jgi:outer membrane receptor protein involved in Fe transport
MNTAAYTHLKMSPSEKLNIIASLRYDRIDYDYDNHLTPTAFSGAPDEKNHFDQLTPKLGLTYDLGKKIGVYGNYSVGFSPPEVSELYRGVKVPRLEPSTYSNYEVGGWFSFANKKGYIDLSLYQLNGINEIISVKQPDGSTEKENAGETRHRGLEYTVRFAPVEEVSFRVSGANAEHLFMDFIEEGNDYTGNLMSTAPSFIANSEVVYRPEFLAGAHVGLEWQHMSEYYMDPANTEKYAGFDVFNLRFGYEVNSVEFWVHTLNLTDENYATIVNKSAWGKSYRVGKPRTFTLGVSYNFAGGTD